MGKQLGFYFDAAACNGCKVCLVACKDKNDNPPGVNYRRVLHYSGGSWHVHPSEPDILVPKVFAYTVSVACNHCADPVCMEVCPAGAISKRADTGLVVIDPDKCVGCRLCETCPYDAPQFNEEKGVMTMCDGCEDLLCHGESPSCVAACPQRALQFGDIEEFRKRHGGLAGVAPLPDPGLTHPSLVVTPHRHSPVSGEQGAVRIEPTVK